MCLLAFHARNDCWCRAHNQIEQFKSDFLSTSGQTRQPEFHSFKGFARAAPSLLPRHKKQTKEQTKSRQRRSEFSHKSWTVQGFNLPFLQFYYSLSIRQRYTVKMRGEPRLLPGLAQRQYGQTDRNCLERRSRMAGGLASIGRAARFGGWAHHAWLCLHPATPWSGAQCLFTPAIPA